MARRDTVPRLIGMDVDSRDMYTFNAVMINSYELGSEEPSALVNSANLFTASADNILNQLAKVTPPMAFTMLMRDGITLCFAV